MSEYAIEYDALPDEAVDIGDYDYEFPQELVAQRALPKGTTRIMHCPKDGGPREIVPATAIVDLLRPGDCLVVNNTKVIPARLRETRESGGTQEVLLVAPRPDLEGTVWEAWVRPGKRFRPGKRNLVLGVETETLAVQEDGARLLRFGCSAEELHALVEAQGKVPLPPYIRREADEEDKTAYQAIFARIEGAVAAPTASLHFSTEMLDAILAKGVRKAEVTLHVGPGTFAPVADGDARAHHMHGERFSVSEEAAETVNRAAREGGRIVAVGTTACRVVETMSDHDGILHAGSGVTYKYIMPPYRWRRVDGLVTNFHWPKSTLMLLVSAFYGRENLLAAYREAIAAKMRLFSYGDGMIIL